MAEAGPEGPAGAAAGTTRAEGAERRPPTVEAAAAEGPALSVAGAVSTVSTLEIGRAHV